MAWLGSAGVAVVGGELGTIEVGVVDVFEDPEGGEHKVVGGGGDIGVLYEGDAEAVCSWWRVMQWVIW